MAYNNNNKRIAKNTILLYFRTLFVMVISLYTSRVILQVLGVEDYGIYQVVGGLVAMFSIISSSLSTAISRFVTFEIGSENGEKLKKIFSTSLIIQIIISCIVLVVVEVIGNWFLESHMKIPVGRLEAARWVLHCSLLTFCINLLSVPYNACIIAHERMKAFAYVSVVEAIMKLQICYLIAVSHIDKLISYAILLVIVALIVRMIYGWYCHKNFEECRTGLKFDKSIFKEMFGFAGWSFFTNTVSIFNNQGVNMLINIYFGVTVNAARGIANQVEGALLQFVGSFTTAINPQITKSYASGDRTAMHVLICRGAKFSFFAMLIMAMPVILETDEILGIWVSVVPEHTIRFVQLSLILGILDCIGSSSYTACMATGNLKRYALIVTCIGILEFPFTWIFFLFGVAVESTYYLYILVKSAILVARMILLRDMIGLRSDMYISNVFIPILLTASVAFLPGFLVVHFVPASIGRLLVTVFVSVISVSTTSLFIGMTAGERTVIYQKIIRACRRFCK